MGIVDIASMIVLAGIGLMIWSATISKEWGFLLTAGALIIVPISAILISRFPLPGFGVAYAVWFALMFVSKDETSDSNEESQSTGYIALKAAQYAVVTVLVALLLNAVFGSGGSGGTCSRATPQFC